MELFEISLNYFEKLMIFVERTSNSIWSYGFTSGLFAQFLNAECILF